MSVSGYISDTKIFSTINYNIGDEYKWNTGDPKPTGGIMVFKGAAITLSRKNSTTKQPAIWIISP